MPAGLPFLFLALGALCLALFHLLPAPSGKTVAAIASAVLFAIAAILAAIPGLAA